MLCTDCHSTYFNLDVLTHQFCLVHLIRNLQYLTDINTSQKWSSDMQQLFRDAIHESNNAQAPPGKEARKNGKSKFGTLYLLITEEEPDSTFIEKYIT